MIGSMRIAGIVLGLAVGMLVTVEVVGDPPSPEFEPAEHRVLSVAPSTAGCLRVPKESLESAGRWLDGVTDKRTGLAGSARPGTAQSVRETAAAALARIHTSKGEVDDLSRRSVERLIDSKPAWRAGRIDMLAWWYGKQAAWMVGGKSWRRFGKALRAAVREGQRRDGEARGSWDPVGPRARAGGRVFSTALMSQCLLQPYRYVRLVSTR